LKQEKDTDFKSKIEQINCVKCESAITQVIKMQEKESQLNCENQNLRQNIELQTEKFNALKEHADKLDQNLKESTANLQKSTLKLGQIDSKRTKNQCTSFVKSLEIVRLNKVIEDQANQIKAFNSQTENLKETIKMLREELMNSKNTSKADELQIQG
jgi:chromosome segregation ATPase